jgi:hypothetical protein
VSRYRVLALVVLAAALGTSALARLPRRAPEAAAPPAPLPVVELAIVLEDGRVTPSAAAVPKDHEVRLAIRNRGARAAEVRLAGYEDRLTIAALAPGATWRGSFVSDRPGEGFAWLVDGEPAGRLAVTGSHLVEGHR